ncbi:MAG: S41 family peptidase, partial [Alphaproteobacteria bacterium]|nr:S41 family peptidase [Alphaproteobacteria bacterium]
MKFSLKRAFAAVAFAGAAVLGLSVIGNETNPLTPEQDEALFELAQTYNVIMHVAQDDAAARPDMKALGAQSLQTMVDKSDTDNFLLTPEEQAQIADILADTATNPHELIPGIASQLGNVMIRAVNNGSTMDEVSAAAIEVLRDTAAAIDAHSAYHTDEEMFDLQNQTIGQFGGVGLQVQMTNEMLTITKPMPNTPGERAGLQADDIITHIGDEPTAGQTLEQSVEKLRGPVDTDVIVTVERAGVTLPPVTLTRAYIEQSPVFHKTIGNDIGFVRLESFNDKTVREIENAINALKTELGDDMRGLILDLRGNPGGLVDQAVGLADLFLESGTIVTMGNGSATDRGATARPGDILNGLPLVVLTDFGSASASEIVAGALQDNNRATVLGMQSFGKGSVQTILPLARVPGAVGGLRLTTALYFTPSGDSIQGRGITPDVRFETEELRKALEEWGDK